MTEMNIRSCGVDSKLDSEGSAKLEFFLQLFLAEDFGCSGGKDVQGIFDRICHGARRLE